MAARCSERTIGRLSLYRRLLSGLAAEDTRHIFSHELAKAAGVTAAQVRRDMMAVGYAGSPTKGYDVRELADSIGTFLGGPTPQHVALVGVGNLGRALLAFFAGRRPNLRIVAAFDKDPQRTGRVIHGCRCYSMEDLDAVVAREGIATAILAVPALAAQRVADDLIAAGVRGLLNFAPAPLHVPPHTFAEDIDITTSLEKVAFFARRDGRAPAREEVNA